MINKTLMMLMYIPKSILNSEIQFIFYMLFDDNDKYVRDFTWIGYILQ